MRSSKKRSQFTTIFAVAGAILFADLCHAMGNVLGSAPIRVDTPRVPATDSVSAIRARRVDPVSTFRAPQSSSRHVLNEENEGQLPQIEEQNSFEKWSEDSYQARIPSRQAPARPSLPASTIDDIPQDPSHSSAVRSRKSPPPPPKRIESLRSSQGDFISSVKGGPLNIDCLWSRIVQEALKEQLLPASSGTSDQPFCISSIDPNRMVNITPIFVALQEHSYLLNNAYAALSPLHVLPKDKNGALSIEVSVSQFLETDIYSLLRGRDHAAASKKLISKILILLSPPYQSIRVSRTFFADTQELLDMLMIYSILCNKKEDNSFPKEDALHPALLASGRLPKLFRERVTSWIRSTGIRGMEELARDFEAVFITRARMSADRIWQTAEVEDRIRSRRTSLFKGSRIPVKECLDILRPMERLFACFHPLAVLLREEEKGEEKELEVLSYGPAIAADPSKAKVYDLLLNFGSLNCIGSDKEEMHEYLNICNASQDITIYMPAAIDISHELNIKKNLPNLIANKNIKISCKCSPDMRAEYEKRRPSKGSVRSSKRKGPRSTESSARSATIFSSYIFTITLYILMWLLIFLTNASFLFFGAPLLIAISALSIIYFHQKRIGRWNLWVMKSSLLVSALLALVYPLYKLLPAYKDSAESEKIYLFVFLLGLVLVGLGLIFLWISYMVSGKNRGFFFWISRVSWIVLLASSLLLAALPLVAMLMGLPDDAVFLCKGHICLVSSVLLLLGALICIRIRNSGDQKRESQKSSFVRGVPMALAILACIVLTILFFIYLIPENNSRLLALPEEETPSFIRKMFSLFGRNMLEVLL